MTLSVGPKIGLLISAQPGEAHFAQLCRFLRGVDAMLGGIRVISRVATLPGVFANGDMYLLTSGTNVNKIARYSIDSQSFSGWEYFTPWDGMPVWSSADQKRYRYQASNSSWVEEASGGGDGMTNPMTDKGDIIVGGDSGAPTRLGMGQPGQVLRIGSSGDLEWYTPSGGGSGGMTNPMTAPGDIIVGGAGGAPLRLGVGASGQTLRVNASGALEWYTPSSGGGAGPGGLPDIYKLMISPKRTRAIPLAASAEIAGYEGTKINNPNLNVISGAVAGGGWLFNLSTTKQYVDLALPFGVIIGDSIAEGHPEQHGRLHPNGSAGFNENYVSQPGQISYELSRQTGTHWYNHGIGSQTTTQMLARFDRDALGKVSDPGDGRGSKTLPGAPAICIVEGGGNDLGQGATEAQIKSNLSEMLNRLLANDIVPIFMTIAPSSGYTAAQRAMAQQVNVWIKSDLKAAGAIIFDLYAWGSDGGTGVKTDLYIDDIHPKRIGYAQLVNDLLLKLPVNVCTKSLRIEFKKDPNPNNVPSGMVNPTGLTLTRDGATLTGQVSGDWIIFNIQSLPALQSPNMRLMIDGPTSGRVGVSKVEVAFSNSIPAAGGSGGGSSAGGLSVSAVLSKNNSGVWEFDSSFTQRGVISVSASSTGVTVTCSPCTMIMCGLVGALAVTNNVKISASWGAAPVTSFTLRFGNGTAQVDPTSAAVPNGTYYSVIGPAPS